MSARLYPARPEAILAAVGCPDMHSAPFCLGLGEVFGVLLYAKPELALDVPG